MVRQDAGEPMKKDNKRGVKDYSEYHEFQMNYHGLFLKNGKLRIDVKRALKINCGPFDEDFLKMINAIPRNTAYFFPKKKKRDEYMCNVFADYLAAIRVIWCREIRQILERIRTPEEAGDCAYSANIQDGVLDPGECSIVRNFEIIKRGNEYPRVVKMVYAQFIHQIGSVVELAQMDVLNRGKNILDYGGRGNLTTHLKENYGVELKEIPNYFYYDRFVCLWNFMKHNSMNSYIKLKKANPEILSEKLFVSGHYSLNYLQLDEDLIFDILGGLREFFNSFCEILFKEDSKEAMWNYDDYFIGEFNIWREDVENPLGIPWYL